METKEEKKLKLSRLIENFLEVRIENDHQRWTQVPNGSLNDMYDIIRTLISLKFEEDTDGDLPVEVYLNDRSKNGPFLYSAIPYYIGLENMSYLEIMNLLEKSLRNLNHAKNEVSTIVNYAASLSFTKTKEEEKESTK